MLDVHNQIFFFVQAAWHPYSVPFKNPKSIVELRREYVLGLNSRSLFVWEGVTYPSRDDVLMIL